MVLYATRPKTLSPADPCNKVAYDPNRTNGLRSLPERTSVATQ
jgi:hypothetical protein